MINKNFTGKVTAVSLYADNRYRFTIDGEGGVGYLQLVCTHDEANSLQGKLGDKIYIDVELTFEGEVLHAHTC